MLDSPRNGQFLITLGVSVLLHGGLALWWSLNFEMPVLLPIAEGRASVQSELRVEKVIAVQPELMSPEPERLPEPRNLEPQLPEILPTVVETFDPELLPSPQAEITIPTELLPAPANPDPPRQVPVEKTRVEEKKQVKPSTPSIASQASQGVVDELPRELTVNQPPQYPPAAERAHQQGTVMLRIKTNAAGRVIGVAVNHSSGFRALDDSAVEAARNWIFSPARRNGVAVPFEFNKPVQFYIRERS